MKLYRTRTQAEYDWLARELGKKGMVSYIPRHEQGGDIVVYADEKEDFLSYSDLDYAEKEYPNEPIIEVSDLMNTKFKVGDEVRVIEETPGILFGNTVGNVCKIKKVNNEDELAYELDNGFLYREDCLEPITDHDYLMDKILERNNKPEKLNTGDPWIDNLPESYFEMYEEEEMLKELTEPLDLIEQHKRICERLNKVYADKNHDYGNSFGATYEKYGDISALVRISDKMNRIEQLVQTGEQKVKDEALEDSILDMANYLIM